MKPFGTLLTLSKALVVCAAVFLNPDDLNFPGASIYIRIIT